MKYLVKCITKALGVSIETALATKAYTLHRWTLRNNSAILQTESSRRPGTAAERHKASGAFGCGPHPAEWIEMD